MRATPLAVAEAFSTGAEVTEVVKKFNGTTALGVDEIHPVELGIDSDFAIISIHDSIWSIFILVKDIIQ